MRLLPLALLALAALPAAPAWAASLRGGTSLSDGSVRLSDLFDGVEADRVIGPAPEPGGRIVVESAQLAAIARQFAVDWRPMGATERIVLERPGRAFPREDTMAALRQALTVAGVSGDAEVEMPGYLPPMVPAGVRATGEVGQVDYSPTTGQFTAVLSVVAPGMSPNHARLSGRVVDMVELPVAVHRMLPGDVVGPGDIQMSRLRANAIRADVAQIPAQAVGMSLRHPVGAGAPLPLADLAHPSAIQRGDLVQMRLESAGLSLSAQGVAMDSGAVGERVRVLNPASRAVVEAEVVARGRVVVSGTTPVLLPPGAALPVRVATR